ncbi:MAG TPA: hypothetical protein ENN46_03300 [Candidatus Woesearchaeota archaeon]|nr:hypothetical protein [Candidatus Woesearchaeota archaeon]
MDSFGFGQKGPAQKDSKPKKGESLLAGNLENINRRLKLNEEKTNLLSRKFELMEQNFVNFQRKNDALTKSTNEELTEFRKELEEIKEVLIKIKDDMKKVAKKQETDALKKYLQLWNPVQFATREDVLMMIERRINEKK